MSAVTKVLVVLLVAMSLVFTSVTISFVAKSHNWRQLAEDYRTQTQLCDAGQRQMAAAHAADLAAARDSIKDLRDRVAGLESDIQDGAEEIAVQAGTIAQLTADKSRADALAQRLTNELSVAQQARTTVEGHRRDLESRAIELERRNVDLNERVAELTTQLAVSKQQQRHLERQINELAGGGGIGGKLSEMPSVVPAPAAASSASQIAGHVEAVDGQLVTISVGSADDVRKGAVFVVFRGNEYIGDIEISDVEPNLAGGRLIRSQPGLSPRKGDRVVDEDHLTASP